MFTIHICHIYNFSALAVDKQLGHNGATNQLIDQLPSQLFPSKLLQEVH